MLNGDFESVISDLIHTIKLLLIFREILSYFENVSSLFII